MSKVLQQIHQLLDAKGLPYRKLHHEPTLTSEESARVRGEELKTGGKAILLKIDDYFAVFVLSAAQKLDSKRLKKHFKAKKLRFASAEELMEKTGLVPGSVPPFGRPILDFDLYVDRSVLQNHKIAFNAGSLTDSVIMQVEHYVTVAKPEVMVFSR
jgi:Ala-tRNA(Pro) deacylase